MSRPHSLHIPSDYKVEASTHSSQCTLRRGFGGGSDPSLWPARGRTVAVVADESRDTNGKGNITESSRTCQASQDRRRKRKEDRGEDEEEGENEEEEEEATEEEEDLWWLTGSGEEESEEDRESLCSLPHRGSITHCSPTEKEAGCSRIRRALTSFSLRLLHTEKERPVQRILRPPRRRQTMRGLSGLPIEATNQWNATTAHEG